MEAVERSLVAALAAQQQWNNVWLSRSVASISRARARASG
jgi:hypothetical protein